jgi:hypothetical protein
MQLARPPMRVAPRYGSLDRVAAAVIAVRIPARIRFGCGGQPGTATGALTKGLAGVAEGPPQYCA